jgi:hypothetical protein
VAIEQLARLATEKMEGLSDAALDELRQASSFKRLTTV